MMEQLHAKDLCITKQLAVCADPATQWTSLRLISRLLELSFHGIPWLIFCCTTILMTTPPAVVVATSSDLKKSQFLVNLLAALVLDLVVVLIVKVTVRRPRPQHNSTKDNMVTFKVDKQFSFPSGHTTRAIMCGCLLLYNYDMKTEYQCLIALWSISASLSRIALGRHYVSDVIAGAVIGYLQFYVMVEYLWLDERQCMDISRWCQSLLPASLAVYSPAYREL